MAYKVNKVPQNSSRKDVDNHHSNNKNYMIFKVDETEYKTLISLKYEKRKPFISHNPKKIFSVIPGTVVKIMAKPGKSVKPGEAIVILEAMKMMNRIILPLGGVIKKINVNVGEVIPKKYLIAELK